MGADSGLLPHSGARPGLRPEARGAAVYIASPNALHFEQCKLFLERGKHVLCEKPLCAQGDKVAQLQQLAQERGLVFLEAIMYLHLPQRKILEDALGQLGKLSSWTATSTGSCPTSSTRPWRQGP